MKSSIKSSMKSFATSLVLSLVVSASAMAAAQSKLINGAGASFPYPIYAKWFATYNQENPTIEINYQSIGSGGGIKQLTAKTVDFGASDAPMTDEELKAAGGPVLHIPTVMGAVVLTYNLPEVKAPLKFTSDVLAKIYMGEIKKWNDAQIVALNKGEKLPNKDIAVAYRSDSSGTTSIFTDYLTKVNPDWAKVVGQGKAVKWPVGVGGKGNEGVTGFVKNTPGALGYVELVYAEEQKLPVAELKNKAGKFVKPSVAAVTEAANGSLKTIPEDFRVSITNADGAGAYPISSFTYLLVYQNMDKEKGGEIVKFLNWSTEKGQALAPAMSYAPLPKSLIAKIKAKISSIDLK